MYEVIRLHKYQQLRDLREDCDLTQQQYRKYENGIQEIPVHHLITLARFYEVTMDYIVGLASLK